MTSDEVFAALATAFRIESFDRNHLTPQTTVRECLATLTADDPIPRPAPVALNAFFDTRISRSQWASFKKSANPPTITDLCEFVATEARVPAMPPRRILGNSCRVAGVFDGVRQLIADEGTDTSNLAPSTALSNVASRPLARALWKIWRLAPSMVDEAKFQMPPDGWYLILAACLLFATMPAVILAATWPMPFLPMPLIVFGAFVAVWRWSVIRQKQGPDAVHFRTLKTVADLCRLIAAEPLPNRKSPSA